MATVVREGATVPRDTLRVLSQITTDIDIYRDFCVTHTQTQNALFRGLKLPGQPMNAQVTVLKTVLKFTLK
jgi:hypothetical protein